MSKATHILNRLDQAPSFKWMHVCPIGEHPWSSADGKEQIVQIIDKAACEAMAASYPLSIPNSRIDIDHESMDAEKRTAAVGWGRRAEVRDDGLWVQVEWNPDGRDLIENKIYKFNSPCFPRDGLVDLGNGRMRVTKLGVIALTNDPNLRGQQPLTNSRSKPANPHTPPPHTMDYKAMLLKALGLPPEATDEQITAACNNCATEKTATTNRISDLEEMVANRDLDDHGITDSEQRKLLTPSLTNKATRPAALALLAKGKPATTEPRTPIHNRGGAAVPKTDLGKGDQEQEADERAFNAEVLDYKNSKGCTYQAAHEYVTNRRKIAAK